MARGPVKRAMAFAQARAAAADMGTLEASTAGVIDKAGDLFIGLSAVATSFTLLTKGAQQLAKGLSLASEKFKQLRGDLAAGALLLRGYQGFLRAASEGTDQWMAATGRIPTTTTQAFSIAIKQAHAYNKLLVHGAQIGVRYGKSAEEVHQVTQAIATQQIRLNLTTKEGMQATKRMTEEALVLSTVLRTDSSVVVQQQADLMWKFGMSAEEASSQLRQTGIWLQYMNRAGEDGTIWAEDFTKIMLEASQNSNRFSTDMGNLAGYIAMVKDRAVNLNLTYTETLALSQAIAKMISQPPEWVEAPVGRSLVEQYLGASPEEMEHLLSKLPPEVAQRVGDIIDDFKTGTETQYVTARRMMEAIGGLEQGSKAVYEHWKEIATTTENGALILQREYGTTIEQAHQLNQILRDGTPEEYAKLAKRIEVENMEMFDKIKQGAANVGRFLGGGWMAPLENIPIIGVAFEKLHERVAGWVANTELAMKLGLAGLISQAFLIYRTFRDAYKFFKGTYNKAKKWRAEFKRKFNKLSNFVQSKGWMGLAYHIGKWVGRSIRQGGLAGKPGGAVKHGAAATAGAAGGKAGKEVAEKVGKEGAEKVGKKAAKTVGKKVAKETVEGVGYGVQRAVIKKGSGKLLQRIPYAGPVAAVGSFIMVELGFGLMDKAAGAGAGGDDFDWEGTKKELDSDPEYKKKKEDAVGKQKGKFGKLFSSLATSYIWEILAIGPVWGMMAPLRSKLAAGIKGTGKASQFGRWLLGARKAKAMEGMNFLQRGLHGGKSALTRPLNWAQKTLPKLTKVGGKVLPKLAKVGGKVLPKLAKAGSLLAKTGALGALGTAGTVAAAASIPIEAFTGLFKFTMWAQKMDTPEDHLKYRKRLSGMPASLEDISGPLVKQLAAKGPQYVAEMYRKGYITEQAALDLGATQAILHGEGGSEGGKEMSTKVSLYKSVQSSMEDQKTKEERDQAKLLLELDKAINAEQLERVDNLITSQRQLRGSVRRLNATTGNVTVELPLGDAIGEFNLQTPAQ